MLNRAHWTFSLLLTCLVTDIQASAIQSPSQSPTAGGSVQQAPAQPTQNDLLKTTPAPSSQDDLLKSTPAPSSQDGLLKSTPAPSSQDDLLKTTPAPSSQNDLLKSTPAPSSQNSALQPTPTQPSQKEAPQSTPNEPSQKDQPIPLPQPSQTQSQEEEQVDPQKVIKNLIAMMVGCEMDNECLRHVLIPVVQSDPDPIYQRILSFVQGQKEDLNCRTPEIIAVKKATAACLNDVLNKPKTPEGDMNACFRNKMEILARQKNVFAQSALMHMARKANDTQGVNGWGAMIQAEVGTSQYEAYQKCPSPLELLEQLSVFMAQRSTMPAPTTIVKPLPQPQQPKSSLPKL